MKIGLCLLVWNELQGCRMDVPAILEQCGSEFDQIYAVDGGSIDGTAAYLTSQGIEVWLQPNPGYNAACLYAFKKCTCDALVFFHPKGTVTIQDLLKFKPYFEKGYDLVIASRLIQNGKNEEDDKLFRYRKWLVMLLSQICIILWNPHGSVICDVLHGFRGMRVDSFNKIKPLQQGLSVDLEMVIRSYKFNLKTIEFPSVEKICQYRGTHFKTLPTGLSLLKYICFELFRRD